MRWLDHVRQDTRQAIRVLRRHPAFTLTVAATLAIGIGTTTAIVSVVQTVLLRPLPYREPATLVALFEHHVTLNAPRMELAPANFVSMRDDVPSLADAAINVGSTLTLTTEAGSELVNGQLVTSNAFRLLGVDAQIGRTLLPDDADPARPLTIVVSHGLWQRRFAADPSLVGRAITLDGAAYTVVGIMPAGFQIPESIAEFWRPLRYTANQWQQRSNHFLQGFARVKPGTTVERAAAEAHALATRLQGEFPQDNRGVDFDIIPLRDAMQGRVRTALVVLLAAVGLLLLVACANVTSLIVTRAHAHRRELAVRAALGAGRGRLARQQLTEGVLLALLGGVLAIAVCVGCLEVLQPLVPATLIPNGLHVDRATLGFGLLMALVTGLLCGSLPALLVARRNLQEALRGSSRGSTAAADETRTRNTLIAAEVALALVLLIGAGLLAKSFVRLLNVDTGLDAGRVLVAEFEVPRFMYADHQARGPLYQRMLDGARAIPGVQSAAIVTSAPFTRNAGGGSSWFTREGRSSARPEELIARNRLVSADYFQTLGVPLRAGRLFDARDDGRSMPVAIVNEVMARRFWPGEDVIGRRFKFGEETSTNPWITIVGVVGDARQFALADEGRPEISRPYQQDAQNWLAPQSLVVRTAGDPRTHVADVRRALLGADRLLPIRAMQPMSDLLTESIATRRLYLLLMGCFASVALLLAAIGIYGVVAYTATQRTREMGIRVALGAHRGDVVRLMLRQGFQPVVIGALAGLGLAALASRVLTTLLFEVKPGDVVTFVAVPVLMLAAAAVAAYIPARRASRVDPIVALRHD